MSVAEEDFGETAETAGRPPASVGTIETPDFTEDRTRMLLRLRFVEGMTTQDLALLFESSHAEVVSQIEAAVARTLGDPGSLS